MTTKVSGELLAHHKARGVVSLTEVDSGCSTRKTDWRAEVVASKQG